MEKDNDFEGYKKHVIKAASDLGYSEDVIQQLEKADSVIELTRIMRTARERKE